MTDVREPEQCMALVALPPSTAFGRVDVLVNNAGVSTSAPATREDPDDFRHVVDVNLNGAYWMAQACGRVIRPGSTIINIGSVLGFHNRRGLPGGILLDEGGDHRPRPQARPSSGGAARASASTTSPPGTSRPR